MFFNYIQFKDRLWSRTQMPFQWIFFLFRLVWLIDFTHLQNETQHYHRRVFAHSLVQFLEYSFKIHHGPTQTLIHLMVRSFIADFLSLQMQIFSSVKSNFIISRVQAKMSNVYGSFMIPEARSGTYTSYGIISLCISVKVV